MGNWSERPPIDAPLKLRLQETVTLTRRQLRANAAETWEAGYQAHRAGRQCHTHTEHPKCPIDSAAGSAPQELETTLPIGTDVTVTRDDGSKWHTSTRTDPWQLGDGTWVVALEGRAGGFSLERVRRRGGGG